MRALLVVIVFAALLAPPPARAAVPEMRAFWVDAFNSGIKNPAQVAQLVDDAARANANTLIVQVRRRGDAYYLAGVEPRAVDRALAAHPYDPLRTLLDAAHSRGIQVHAWIATLAVWRTTLGTPPDGHLLHQHGPDAGPQSWVMFDANGQPNTSENDIWLDPGNPDAVAHTERVVRDILARYPDLDGLHLDRIRYPGTSYGYNPVAVARFNQQFNRTGAPQPADQQWTDWRRDQVSALVRRIALAAAEVAPDARLSAAVIAWGDGPEQSGGWERSAPYRQVLQDWRGWLREGIIDTAVVMNYDRDHDPVQRAFFDHWLAWETSQAGGEVVVGPAAYLNSVDGTLAQVRRAQSAGAAGVALYSYATNNKDGLPRATLLDALAAGPFAEPAVVPTMPWKEGRGAVRGTLSAAPGLAQTWGVPVLIAGPEQRVVHSDSSGWFGALRLAPGQYTLILTLDAETVLRARANVGVGGVAEVRSWEVVSLPTRLFLPLTAQ